MPQLADTEPSPRSGPAFPLLESKLHPPPARPTLVLRSALVERVAQASSVAVVTIVAPPGYGKTTLLTQLAEPVARRAAWLSLDDGDNDPEILMSYIAGALDRVETIEPAVFRMVKRRGFSVASTAARRLAEAMEAMAEPPVLFLDQVESLHNPECLDAIAALALHLPAGSRLILASRDAPPIARARMQAVDALLEIGVDDLAMDPAASRALLIGAGVELDETATAALIERTEGWPAGLYLAALAYRAGGADAAAALSFSGDDRLLADYLRSELLSRLSESDVSFLTRTSVLDRMSGQLCDAALGIEGSAEILASLARSNLFLVALDRDGDWYRYHHLFRDLLRAEWVGANRAPSSTSTAAPRRGAKRTASPRSRWRTPNKPATATMSRRSCSRSCNRCGRAGGSKRSCGGWSGSSVST